MSGLIIFRVFIFSLTSVEAETGIPVSASTEVIHELDIVSCHAPDEIVDRIRDGLRASAEGVY